VRLVDEIDGAVGWIDDDDRLRRTSHALGHDGRVWLVDVVDDPRIEEWVGHLGEPAGVVQLLDRHNRDCAAVAARLGVPHHVVPGSLAGTPFELRPILRSRWWREAALWWPERKLLVCADALGTVPHYFRAGPEPAGVHPFLRPRPPRSLRGLEPDHLLVGHGEGVHRRPAAVADALRTARRRIPRWLVGLPRLARSR
jgi:hypothetical protein